MSREAARVANDLKKSCDANDTLIRNFTHLQDGLKKSFQAYFYK